MRTWSPASRPRSTSSGPSTCAMSNPARCSSSMARACEAFGSRPRPRRTFACSSSSTLPVQTARPGGAHRSSRGSRPARFACGSKASEARVPQVGHPPERVRSRSDVYDVRKSLGEALAREHPVDCDVVIPVPDSGVPAAIGYAAARKVPFEMGLIRSHYVGRTFIEPQQSIRHFGVRLKLNPVEPTLRGKRVVIIDDSIVRGTTSRKIVKMARRRRSARCTSASRARPPVALLLRHRYTHPPRAHCVEPFNRRDRPLRDGRHTRADLSLEGMLTAVAGPGAPSNGFCHACFSGDYAIPFKNNTGPQKKQMRLVGV